MSKYHQNFDYYNGKYFTNTSAVFDHSMVRNYHSEYCIAYTTVVVVEHTMVNLVNTIVDTVHGIPLW